MDVTLRFRAFQLATHYWEARWIEEMQINLEKSYKDGFTRDKKTRRWRRYAKITPCFVSTLYKTPDFFSAYEGSVTPIRNLIDLLVIDEAGQVAPEIAGATFAMARCAVIVGDEAQIQPVSTSLISVDRANLTHYGLLDPSWAARESELFVEKSGMAASRGSVLRIAQRASAYQYEDYELRGMFLRDHFRCQPQIMDYFNNLSYDGILRAVNPRFADIQVAPELPFMGYARITNSKAEKVGGSRVNRIEARTIIEWLLHSQALIDWLHNSMAAQKLRKRFASPELNLSQVIGIVTPFKQQANIIKSLLKQTGKTALQNIKVGTVHTFQGGEQPIIIFSPVYDTPSSSYFFDRDKSMLNVAVSRAQESFLVFGSMAIFRPKEHGKPSEQLASLLFKYPQNELSNIPIIK